MGFLFFIFLKYASFCSIIILFILILFLLKEKGVLSSFLSPYTLNDSMKCFFIYKLLSNSCYIVSPSPYKGTFLEQKIFMFFFLHRFCCCCCNFARLHYCEKQFYEAAINIEITWNRFFMINNSPTITNRKPQKLFFKIHF